MPWATLDGKNADTADQAAFAANPNYAPLAAANPFSVSNGVLDLAIKPTPASINPADVNNKAYVRGLLQTSSSFSQLYGYFEMRAQLPAGNGVGGAFWLLPQNGAWPPEIDVVESLGQDPSTVYQTLHDGSPGNVSNLQITAAVPGGNDATSFHTYGVDWEARTTTLYLDGKATGSFATPATMNTPMYMILSDNASSTSNWGKPVDGSTPFPADFKVDYVRAYASMPDLSSGGSPNPGGAPPPVVTPPVVAPPIVTPPVSQTNAITPGVGSFADAAGNAYKIDASGNAYENGAPMPDSGNTGAMRYAGGQVYGQDATSRSWYTWNQATWTAAAAPPAVTPPPAATGADTLTLSLSEDAWQGDAQAVITVDGKPAGGTVTVTASHSQGKAQAVSLAGAWGPGPHDVGVQFINDAYGGSGTADRNLYVNAATFDGQASAAAPAGLYSNGTAHLTTGASPLVLTLSEDAYLGNAQFTVAVDGKALGGAQSVTAPHASGAAQNFAFGQAMAAGTHDVAVSFLNDAWGGSAAADRNLYVNAVTVNGAAMPGTAASLLSTATQHFSVVVAAHL